MMVMKKKGYSVMEVAKMAGVSRDLVHQWIRDGKFGTPRRRGLSPRSPYVLDDEAVSRVLTELGLVLPVEQVI